MQDMVPLRKPLMTKTSAHEAGCHVCGKGLDDGFSVTAKTLRNNVVLFCDIHYKMQ